MVCVFEIYHMFSELSYCSRHVGLCDNLYGGKHDVVRELWKIMMLWRINNFYLVIMTKSNIESWPFYVFKSYLPLMSFSHQCLIVPFDFPWWFLLVFHDNVWPDLAPLRNIRPQNLECNFSMPLKNQMWLYFGRIIYVFLFLFNVGYGLTRLHCGTQGFEIWVILTLTSQPCSRRNVVCNCDEIGRSHSVSLSGPLCHAF